MIASGWESEVKYLCDRYPSNLPLLDTLGYREMRQYLVGEITFEEAKDLTILHTRQFAKRQRTWFRADSEIKWFDCDRPDLLEQVWQQVEEFVRC
jgi:tRNA dimethylallyltransferase